MRKLQLSIALGTLCAVAILMGGAELTAASGQCIQSGDPLTGRLIRAYSVHPNGTEIVTLQIGLDAPTCFELVSFESGDVVQATVKLVHVTSEDEAIQAQLKSLVGDRIVVSGDYDWATTAWHIGDVVSYNSVVVESGVPWPPITLGSMAIGMTCLDILESGFLLGFSDCADLTGQLYPDGDDVPDFILGYFSSIDIFGSKRPIMVRFDPNTMTAFSTTVTFDSYSQELYDQIFSDLDRKYGMIPIDQAKADLWNGGAIDCIASYDAARIRFLAICRSSVSSQPGIIYQIFNPEMTSGCWKDTDTDLAAACKTYNKILTLTENADSPL